MFLFEDRLQKALNKLTPLERRTVLLCWYYGFSYKQAAKELRIDALLVKRILARAKKKAAKKGKPKQ